MNYGLNEIYAQYEKAVGIKRELFGCLYKMYGGKKEVSYYSMETLWYLSVLDRMNSIDLKYRDKRLKFEKEVTKVDNKKLKELEKKFREESFEFYRQAFISCLFWLKHYYNIKYETKKDKIKVSYIIMDGNGDILYQGVLNLMFTYESGQIHKELNTIYNLLKDMKGLRLKESVIQSAMNETLHIMFNTKLKIKDYCVPKFKEMLIC